MFLRKVKKVHGITLIEAMLALAIMAMVVLAGLRFYKQYSDAADGWRVNRNVEALFQGLTNYYRANCRGGTLDPSYSPVPPTGQYAVTLGSLSGYISNWQPLNPIIDATGPGGGYIVQFNRQPSTPPDATTNITSCNAYTTSPACNTYTTLLAVPNSHVVMWLSQVAVKLKDPTQASRLLLQLSANCISSYSGGLVTPCSASPAPGGYLVWQQPATYISKNTPTSSWLLRPTMQQFVLQYTTDGIGTLSGAYSTGAVDGVHVNDSRNYLCGE